LRYYSLVHGTACVQCCAHCHHAQVQSLLCSLCKSACQNRYFSIQANPSSAKQIKEHSPAGHATGFNLMPTNPAVSSTIDGRILKVEAPALLSGAATVQAARNVNRDGRTAAASGDSPARLIRLGGVRGEGWRQGRDLSCPPPLPDRRCFTLPPQHHSSSPSFVHPSLSRRDGAAHR
jgi:hypothetical protein